MKHYVGLDVSLKEVSICVVDADGTVFAERKVATEPSEILSWIEERVGAVERIVHESGPLSIWLTRELLRRGAPVVWIDARVRTRCLRHAWPRTLQHEWLIERSREARNRN